MLDYIKEIEKTSNEVNSVLYDENAEIDAVVATWTDTDGIYVEDVGKANPYHAKDGKFTNAPGGAANPMIRTEPPPKKTKIAYKVFVARDGKLYPPMVANPNAEPTPVGVWLNASEGKRAMNKDGTPKLNTLGRERVVAGGKGTQGGSGELAYRPGWHLGEVPQAKQFYTKDKVTVEKKQKKNFVWAECEIAADVDYQEEAMSYGYNKKGNFQHSLAGLPKLPKDGYYKYRTNPDPSTEPWYITGAMRVKRLLTDAETNEILRRNGYTPMPRDGGELDLKALGFTETNFVKKSFSIYKTESDKRLVFGWASISITVDGEQLEDRQKDMIDPEDLEEAAYEYVLNFRDTGEEHIPTMRKKGKLVESCVFTAEKQKAMGIPEGIVPVGWWIGFKIEDDDAWERVKNGTYKMFSIEGKANREQVEKAAHIAKTFNEILEQVEKFNPYHGRDGRFATSAGATSFTYAPGKSKAHDLAIQREKERAAGAAASTPQMKAVHSIEDNIRAQFYETAAVVDKDGKVLFRKDGAANQVGFSKAECEMMKGSTLTHNHPKSSMFSVEDTLCFARNDLQEMRATTREGTTYSMKRGEGYTKDKGERFVIDYDGEMKAARRLAQRELDRRGFMGKIMDGEITQEEANIEFGKVMAHVMVDYCDRKASNYGIDFSVEKRNVKPKNNLEVYSKKSADDEVLILDKETDELTDAAFKEWLEGGAE